MHKLSSLSNLSSHRLCGIVAQIASGQFLADAAGSLSASLPTVFTSARLIVRTGSRSDARQSPHGHPRNLLHQWEEGQRTFVK